jgi:hypothetical protein
MAILCFSVSSTAKITHFIYMCTYTPKKISDEDTLSNHAATAIPHCHFNANSRASKVTFKDIFKRLKIIWGMKVFTATENQFNTVYTRILFFSKQKDILSISCSVLISEFFRTKNIICSILQHHSMP